MSNHCGSQEERSKSIDLFSSSPLKALESKHRSVPRSASVDHGRVPMDISPSVPGRQQQKTSSDGDSGGGAWAKFCHECGTSYPTVLAKFCPECGEKRVYKL